MSRWNYSVRLCEDPDVVLRTASRPDLEALRTWKNANRDYFFHRKLITTGQQADWFDAYLDRPDDHMFVIVKASHPVGCIGFRLLEGSVDFYNLIVGDVAARHEGVMTMAFHKLAREASQKYPGLPIAVVVLIANPAVGWYQRRGFSIVEEFADSFRMVLRQDALDSCTRKGPAV